MKLENIANPELINKYSVAGPRYTSYPTAVEFHSDYTAQDWTKELDDFYSADEGERPVAFYIHIPFCHSLCLFCACSRTITSDLSVVPPYLEALAREIEFYKGHLPKNVRVQQIHWGGGTPNYLLPEQILTLGNLLKESFPGLSEDADLSVELDPRTVTLDQLVTLNKLGFNRVSIGIQDFDPVVQKNVNRIQSYEGVIDLVQECRKLGFGSINFDLIYGLPGQTIDSIKSTVDKVISLRPDRIAFYGYAHVTWRSKAQKSLVTRGLPDVNQRLEFFLQSVKQLVGVGYQYIGMDHFALEDDMLSKALDQGTLHRNFMGYSTHKGVAIVGLGASSISCTPRAFAQNIKESENYQMAISETGLAIERGYQCSRDDQIRGDLIETILCAGSINFSEFNSDWQIDFVEYFPEYRQQLSGFIEDGLLNLNNDGFEVTELGRFFVRNIAMTFDAYLEKHRQDSKPRFSQTV